MDCRACVGACFRDQYTVYAVVEEKEEEEEKGKVSFYI